MKDRIALALLALLVVIAFANVVFGGKSLNPSENANPLDPRMTERNSGPNFVPPEEWSRRDLVGYPNYRDVVASTMQYEPARELFRRSLLRGEFPFWDPYIGAGNPSFASLVPAYLFPPTLIVTLLGNGSLIRNIYTLLLILCSGVLTYAMLRQHGLSRQGAFAGAVAFMFSGGIIQTVTGLGQPAAFFSLPLIVTARLIDAPGARRAAQLALAFAFIALASFPPILMQIFGTCVLYAVVALIVRGRAQFLRTAVWFAAGAAVSLAIVAVAYFPATNAMAESTHIRSFYKTAALATLQPRYIGQLLSPSIMGGADIYAVPAVGWPTGLHLYYTGVVALFLAGIGFLAKSHVQGRILKITAATIAVLSLAKIFGLPPVHWISSLPFLRNIHYAAYFGIAVTYAVAILAALGIDAALQGNARRWHVALVGAGLLAALVVLRIMAGRRGVQFHPQGWRWIADYRLLVLFSVLAIAALWFALQSTRRAAVLIAVILAVLGVEGITNSSYPRPRRWNIWSHPPRYVEVVSELNTGGRVLPMPLFPANTESAFGQFTIDSIANFTSTRVYGIYKRYFVPNARFFFRETHRIPPERVLDAVNVEYIAISAWNTGPLADAAERGYEMIYSDDLVHLMRRRATPRYTFTSNYRVVPSSFETIEALATLPPRTVLLENAPAFPSAESTADVLPRLVHFSLNAVEIAVDTPQAGLLVCSESNMNGWSATVDGRPSRILAANHAFRAVEVPPGSHVVRFRYRAPGFASGLAVSLAGILVCALGLWRRPLTTLSPEP
ncbi:MAG TPA: YfhO family protein [Thermoanaerobaculia bacterium]|nr:YfhO family protein [Thermoanaerobaculia bacterium]